MLKAKGLMPKVKSIIALSVKLRVNQRDPLLPAASLL